MSEKTKLPWRKHGGFIAFMLNHFGDGYTASVLDSMPGEDVENLYELWHSLTLKTRKTVAQYKSARARSLPK